MGISTSAQTQIPLYEELNSEDASQGLNHFHKKSLLYVFMPQSRDKMNTMS